MAMASIHPGSGSSAGAKYSVKRTDCYSFFGWTAEDEGRAAGELVAGAGEAGAARKRQRRDGGESATKDLVVGFGAEADAALMEELGSAVEEAAAGSGSASVPAAVEPSASTAVATAPLSAAAARAVRSSRACGLELFLVAWKHPQNVGSVLRLAACFGVQRVHHVRRSPQPVPLSVQQRNRMLTTARGCDRLVARRQWSVAQLLAFLDDRDGEEGGASPSRLPIVALETAEGAVPLPSFAFPRRCLLLAGAEGRGLELKVLRRLRRGFDAIVYVPMPGAHKSLNAAEAVCCAAYEYRRQWPG